MCSTNKIIFENQLNFYFYFKYHRVRTPKKNYMIHWTITLIAYPRVQIHLPTELTLNITAKVYNK